MKVTKGPTCLQCGVLAGLALLLAGNAFADKSLRDQVHRQYKDRSYMLIEDSNGARLYLFGNENTAASTHMLRTIEKNLVDQALEKVRVPDARTRVRGLTELAGVDDPAALNAALALLVDPEKQVRDEAAILILDHPQGADIAAALGLVDEDTED